MQRAIEALTVIFWLATWAVLASYASALNLAGAGRAVTVTGLTRRGPPSPSDDYDDEGLGIAASATATDAASGLGMAIATNPSAKTSSAPGSALQVSSASAIQAAEISIGVDAGLGAIIWVLFIITLVMTSEYPYFCDTSIW
jgi:hypothetical protein